MGCSVMAAGSSPEGKGMGMGPGEGQGRRQGHRRPLSHPLLLLPPGALFPKWFLNCLPGPEYHPRIRLVPRHLRHTLQPYSKDHHANPTGDRHTPLPRTRCPWNCISDPQDPLQVCLDPLKTLNC